MFVSWHKSKQIHVNMNSRKTKIVKQSLFMGVLSQSDTNQSDRI